MSFFTRTDGEASAKATASNDATKTNFNMFAFGDVFAKCYVRWTVDVYVPSVRSPAIYVPTEIRKHADLSKKKKNNIVLTDGKPFRNLLFQNK